MNLSRRSFFRRAAAAVVGVIAAPYLPKPAIGGLIPAEEGLRFVMPVPMRLSPFWYQTSRWASYRSNAYMKALWRLKYAELRIQSRESGVPIQTLLDEHYAGVRQGEVWRKAFAESMFLGKAIA